MDKGPVDNLKLISGVDNDFQPQSVGLLQDSKAEIEMYFAIFIPANIKAQYDDSSLIFVNKVDCLNMVKRIPGARFKSFSSLCDAENFMKIGPPILSIDKEVKGLLLEKPSVFRGPSSQDLVKFRKSIERSNIDYFEECVYKNPRYLVSSGDTPSILQEGSRYNALHISCRYNRYYICQRILTILSDEKFFIRLYPDECAETAKWRSNYIVDLYLNMPDKGLNETPLHFACKHGSVDCIKILLSYPACDKSRNNKFDEKPIDIVCSRSVDASATVKDKITELLGDPYYVPILRNDDNCIPPQIGLPWSPVGDHNSLLNTTESFVVSPTCSSSPINPFMKVKGYAGPMSPQRAGLFYHKWRKSISSPSRPGQPTPLGLQDLNKGLERIGRNLALEHNVDWNEYWDFLGAFINLPSEEGLKELNAHLKKQYKAAVTQLNAEIPLNSFEVMPNEADCLGESNESNVSSRSIGEICRGLEALRLNASFSPNSKIPDTNSVEALRLNVAFSPTSKTSDTNSNWFLLPLPSGGVDPKTGDNSEYYSFIVQSISMSSEKLFDSLKLSSEGLELHSGPDFEVTRRLKIQIKRELGQLRKVLVNFCHSHDDEKFNLSFVHILLVVQTSNLVLKELTADKIHLLVSTLQATLQTLLFWQDDSSDEEPPGGDADAGQIGHFRCFVETLKKALQLTSNFTKVGDDISIKVEDLGLSLCTCQWGEEIEGVPLISELSATRSPDTTELSASASKLSRVKSFLRRVLFGVKRNKPEKESSAAETITEAGTADVDDCDSFTSAVSSLEEDEGGMATPEETIMFFICGDAQSKVDLDVLRAIDGVDIDPEKYLYISLWKNALDSNSIYQRRDKSYPEISFSVLCQRKLHFGNS